FWRWARFGAATAANCSWSFRRFAWSTDSPASDSSGTSPEPGISGAVDEEPRAGTARKKCLVASRTRRAAGGIAPDHQRHRNGQIRPELAAGIQDRAVVRLAHRDDFPGRGNTMKLCSKRNGAWVAIAAAVGVPTLQSHHHAHSEPPPSLQTPAPSGAQPVDALKVGLLTLTRCELKQPDSAATTAAYCAPFEVPENRADPHSRKIQLKLAIV